MACYLASIWQLTTAPKTQPDTYQAVSKLLCGSQIPISIFDVSDTQGAVGNLLATTVTIMGEREVHD